MHTAGRGGGVVDPWSALSQDKPQKELSTSSRSVQQLREVQDQFIERWRNKRCIVRLTVICLKGYLPFVRELFDLASSI